MENKDSSCMCIKCGYVKAYAAAPCPVCTQTDRLEAQSRKNAEIAQRQLDDAEAARRLAAIEREERAFEEQNAKEEEGRRQNTGPYIELIDSLLKRHGGEFFTRFFLRIFLPCYDKKYGCDVEEVQGYIDHSVIPKLDEKQRKLIDGQRKYVRAVQAAIIANNKKILADVETNTKSIKRKSSALRAVIGVAIAFIPTIIAYSFLSGWGFFRLIGTLLALTASIGIARFVCSKIQPWDELKKAQQDSMDRARAYSESWGVYTTEMQAGCEIAAARSNGKVWVVESTVDKWLASQDELGDVLKKIMTEISVLQGDAKHKVG